METAVPDTLAWAAGVTTERLSMFQLNEVIEPLVPAAALAPPAMPVAYVIPVAPV